MKIFLILVFSFLLFSAPVYALRGYDKKDVSSRDVELEKEAPIPMEVREEIEALKIEKKKLIEKSRPEREKRAKTLYPFKYERFLPDSETTRRRYVVQGIIPIAPNNKTSQTTHSNQGILSKPLPNLIFFSVLIIAFLFVYYLFRPKK